MFFVFLLILTYFKAQLSFTSFKITKSFQHHYIIEFLLLLAFSSTLFDHFYTNNGQWIYVWPLKTFIFITHAILYSGWHDLALFKNGSVVPSRVFLDESQPFPSQWLTVCSFLTTQKTLLCCPSLIVLVVTVCIPISLLLPVVKIF